MNSKLRGIIAQKGTSMREISNLLGITNVTLWSKIRGTQQFKLNEIKLILKHFNATFEELF